MCKLNQITRGAIFKIGKLNLTIHKISDRYVQFTNGNLFRKDLLNDCVFMGHNETYKNKYKLD